MRSSKAAVILGAVASLLACGLALSGCAGAAGSGVAGTGVPTSGSSAPSGSASGSPGSGGGGGSGDSSSGPSQSITGAWRLVSGTGSSGAIALSGSTVTLTINGASSGGNGGCNAFGADATGSTTGPFSIRVGIHTDMACVGGGRNITEQQYFSALSKIDTASITNGELILTGHGATLTFERSGS